MADHLETVRKLLARTEESSGCSPEERRTAAEMAARLIQKHGLLGNSAQSARPLWESFQNPAEDEISREFVKLNKVTKLRKDLEAANAWIAELRSEKSRGLYLREFFDTHCRFASGARVGRTELREAADKWSKRRKFGTVRPRDLAAELRKRGVEPGGSWRDPRNPKKVVDSWSGVELLDKPVRLSDE